MASFDRSILRQPRWILAIVVALLFAGVFVRLGLWQLDRLDERRTANALIEERRVTDPQPLGDLTARHGSDPEDLLYRQAIVEGDYRDDLEFLSVGRTAGDVTGTLVATPLELDDGSLMIVVRGVVPAGSAGPPVDGFRTPDGRVVLVGRLDDGEEPLRIGEPDPPGGVITSLSRLDLAYIDRWIEGDVLPISLVLDAQEPASEGTPVALPEEELSEGSHLGYAIQWFAFAAIAIGGVAYLIYRAGIQDTSTRNDPDSVIRQ